MDNETCSNPTFNRDFNKDFSKDFKRNSGNRINSSIIRTKTIAIMDSDLLTLLAGFSIKPSVPK